MKSKEYQALATHPVFRPVAAGNYARLFTERPFDFVNPAAQVAATRPALMPFFDTAYQALLSQSPETLFLQAQQTAHKPESIVTMLICAEMHNRHSLDNNNSNALSIAALQDANKALDDLMLYKQGLDNTHNGVTAEHLTKLNIPVPSFATTRQIKGLWATVIFRDLCTLYSRGLSTLGLSSAPDNPQCSAIRRLASNIMADALPCVLDTLFSADDLSAYMPLSFVMKGISADGAAHL